MQKASSVVTRKIAFLCLIATLGSATTSQAAVPAGETPAQMSARVQLEAEALKLYTTNLTLKFHPDSQSGSTDATKFLGSKIVPGTPAKKVDRKPFLGSEEEIIQTQALLGKKDMKGVYLVAVPGAGKSSFINELALRSADKNYYQVDISTFASGDAATMTARWKLVLSAIENDPKGVLVIDEAHTFFSKPFAEPTKPAMAEGKFPFILITDNENYRKFFEPDAAWVRRGIPVWINDPSPDIILGALRRNYFRYTEHHGKYINDEGLQAIVRNVKRFFGARPQISEALSIQDNILSLAAIDKSSYEVRQINLKIQLLTAERDVLAHMSNRNATSEKKYADRIIAVDGKLTAAFYERAQLEGGESSPLLPIIKELEEIQRDMEMATKAERWKDVAYAQQQLSIKQNEYAEKEAETGAFADDISKLEDAVGVKDVNRYFAMRAGSPISALNDPAKYLTDLLESLRSQVVSQEKAVGAIYQSQLRAVGDMAPHKGPNSVILLAGASGPRSALARALATYKYPNSTERYVQIGMEQLGEHAAMQIAGSGRGLVDSDKGSITEPIRQRNGHVVAQLNNIDSMHHANYDQLKPMLVDGWSKDAMDRVTDFSGTDIIMTADWGSEWAANRGKWSPEEIVNYLGIQTPPRQLKEGEKDLVKERAIEYVRSINDMDTLDAYVLEQEMIRAGVPESIRNAITSRVLVDPATKEDAIEITKRRLATDKQYALDQHGLNVEFSPDLEKALVDAYMIEGKGYGSVARGLDTGFETFLAKTRVQLGTQSFDKKDVLEVSLVDAPDAPGDKSIVANFVRNGTSKQIDTMNLIVKAADAPDAAAGRVASKLFPGTEDRDFSELPDKGTAVKPEDAQLKFDFGDSALMRRAIESMDKFKVTK